MKPFLRTILSSLFLWSSASLPCDASIAYGSLNNFDTVNDTGQECHGFEIEIEDCHSTDITYTFDYNHYGVPHISQDDSIPGHPKCRIRWESKKNPNGTWAAYTAIPAGPIAPTNGHMFTNPSINFGGEHFGVGYSAAVGAVRYQWLVADASGNLVHGGAVQVSTPSFVYYPAVVAQAVPAQVQAVIQPPPEPVPAKEFGNAVWMKEIRTTTHNSNKVKLRDLVSDDPEDANDVNWRNNEPDEVEVEWQILQKDFHKADGGANNEVAAAAENLPDGDEVVTRRYEFFEYTGPFDDESGEAMAQSVAADDLHGDGEKMINGVMVDLSTIEVVGEYKGAQMAAVDAEAVVGLIDHVSEAVLDEEYASRKLVTEGTLPFVALHAGDLPVGMAFDETTGILSGTPEEAGEFTLSVVASDFVHPEVAKNYTLRVVEAGVVVPPSMLVDTIAAPMGAGTTMGDGSYAPGETVILEAVAQPGYHFVNWVDNNVVVSTTALYEFVIDINHSLVANFAPDVTQFSVELSAAPLEGGTVSGGGLVDEGASRIVHAVPAVGYGFSHWSENGANVSSSADYNFVVSSDRALVAHFTTLPSYVITTSASAAGGGTASGGGSFLSGTSVTLSAEPLAGYVFSKWTVNGSQVSTAPSYTFVASANRSVVAHFVVIGSQAVIAATISPLVAGSVQGAGNYAISDEATLIAVPNVNYKFSKWTEGSTTVSTSPTLTFSVTGNRTLVAKFVEAFVITADWVPALGGSTEMDSATYKTGEKAKAQAMPDNGYEFWHWTENGSVVSEDESYTFDVTGPRQLVAHFRSITGVTIETMVAAAGGGLSSGDGDYLIDDNVQVQATADEGYVFARWTDGGNEVSTDETYAFAATTHRSLVAQFVPAVTVACSASIAEAGSISGDGVYATGSNVQVSAAVSAGYTFRGWKENGNFVSTAENYSFTVTTARTLVADFLELPALQFVPGDEVSPLILCWPVESSGWQLEESSNMIQWLPSVRAIQVDGGLNKIHITPSGSNRYFRLAHP